MRADGIKAPCWRAKRGNIPGIGCEWLDPAELWQGAVAKGAVVLQCLLPLGQQSCCFHGLLQVLQLRLVWEGKGKG